VRPADASSPVQAPSVEVVRHYAWQGAPHATQYGALVSLLRETWRVQRLAVDATGIGEPLAAFLGNALGPSRVEAVKLSTDTKSSLGYELLTAVGAGRVRLYTGIDAAECRRQLEHCRAVYKPNRTLSFYVDQRDGHDDYVISLALCVSAAANGGPRTARGRREI
jgi:phage FluMu gp28-like protein